MNHPAPDFGVSVEAEPWSAVTGGSVATLATIAALLAVGLISAAWVIRRRRARSSLAFALSGVLCVGLVGYLAAVLVPEGQIAFPKSDPSLVALVPGVVTEPADPRVDLHDLGVLLEERYGLTGVVTTLQPETSAAFPFRTDRVTLAAIQRDLIVQNPDGSTPCALTNVALVDGDRTYRRVAIMCGGQELPTDPDRRPEHSRVTRA